MQKFLVAFFIYNLVLTESEPIFEPLSTGYWNNSKVRILLIEYMISFFLYLVILGLDLVKKKFHFYPSQQKVEIVIEKKQQETKDQFPQIDEDAFEPKEQNIEDQEQPQFDPADDQKIYIEGKSIHEYCYDILIIHGLCLGFVITGGYHSLGLLFMGWIHMGAFIVFLVVNHLQKLQQFFKMWMFLFCLINFLILVISLAHVKQFNNKQIEWIGKNLQMKMQVIKIKRLITIENIRETLRYLIQKGFSTRSIEKNVKATKQFNIEEEMKTLKKQNQRLQEENIKLKQENQEFKEKLIQNEKVFQKFGGIKELIKSQKNYISELQLAVQEKDKNIEQLVFLNSIQKQIQQSSNQSLKNQSNIDNKQSVPIKKQIGSQKILQLLQQSQDQKKNNNKNFTFKNDL